MYSEQPYSHRLLPSFRFAIAFLMFCMATLLYANFAGMNIAIVCMVNSTNLDSGVGLSEERPCNITEESKEMSGYGGHLPWSRREQSIVLAAFAKGAVVTVFIAGILTDKYGARNTGIVACFLLAITSYLTPISTQGGIWVVTFVRIIQGVGGISAWPFYLVIASKWFPVHERGMLTAIGVSGQQIGTIFAKLAGSYFCKTSTGWPLYYYVLGTLDSIFLLTWTFLYTDDVAKSRFLSHKEAEFILASRAGAAKQHKPSLLMNGKLASDDSTSETIKNTQPRNRVCIPWLSIVRSRVVWSLVFVTFCSLYIFYFVGIYMPTYYKEVLGINVGTSGILSSLPSIMLFIGRIVAGPCGDRFDRRFGHTITVKTMTAIAGYGPSLLLLLGTAFDCQYKYVVVFCFSAAYFLNAFAVAGFLRAALLVAPDFVGTIAGACQTASYSAALVVPYLTGTLISEGTKSQWNNCFYLAAGISSLGTTLFLIFGSGEPQSWGVMPEILVPEQLEKICQPIINDVELETL